MMYNLIMKIEYTEVSLKINGDTTAVMYNTQHLIIIIKNSQDFAWSAYYIKTTTFYSNKAYVTYGRLRLLSIK